MKIMIVEILEFIENYLDLFYNNDVALSGLLNADYWRGFIWPVKELFYLLLFYSYVALRRSQREETHFPGNKRRKTKSNKQYDDHHVIEFAYTINKQNPASLGL